MTGSCLLDLVDIQVNFSLYTSVFTVYKLNGGIPWQITKGTKEYIKGHCSTKRYKSNQNCKAWETK